VLRKFQKCSQHSRYSVGNFAWKCHVDCLDVSCQKFLKLKGNVCCWRQLLISSTIFLSMRLSAGARFHHWSVPQIRPGVIFGKAATSGWLVWLQNL
jgi:hypothetical protein